MGEVLRYCDACGFVRFGQLVLTAVDTAQQIRIEIDTGVTRNLIRSIDSDGSRFASALQFRLLRDRELKGWAVVEGESPKNATHLNGKALGVGPIVLKEGDLISVGANRARLRVSLTD